MTANTTDPTKDPPASPAESPHGEDSSAPLTSHPNQGLVDWLTSCPVKGYFVPIESESTDG